MFLFHHTEILPFFSCCWGIPRQSSLVKRSVLLISFVSANEKTSCYRDIDDLILQSVITQIFARMADFLASISSSRKVFFPSNLHFDYTAPFDFLLRDHNCLIEVFSFNGPKLSVLSWIQSLSSLANRYTLGNSCRQNTLLQAFFRKSEAKPNEQS